MLFPSCSWAARREVIAPLPSLVEARAGDRDWFGLASHIEQSSDFRPFEPILEELTGERPVPHTRVYFVDNGDLHNICSENAGGCFVDRFNEIFIGRQVYDSGLTQWNIFAAPVCDMPEGESLSPRSRFDVWLHEQGHHYDRYLTDTRRGEWIDQTEAEAFDFYAAEHIARNYDRRLGLNLLGNKITEYGLSDWIYYPQTALEGSGVIFSRISRDFDQWAGDLSDASVLLLFSHSRPTFGDVWYYIHTHEEEQVGREILESAENPEESMRVLSQRLLALSGGSVTAPSEFDTSIIENFELGEDVLPPLFRPDPDRTVLFSITDSTYVRITQSTEEGNPVVWLRGGRVPMVDANFLLSIYLERPDSGESRLSIAYGLTEPRIYLRMSPPANLATLIARPNSENLPVCGGHLREIDIDYTAIGAAIQSMLLRISSSFEQQNHPDEAEFVRSLVHYF